MTCEDKLAEEKEKRYILLFWQVKVNTRIQTLTSLRTNQARKHFIFFIPPSFNSRLIWTLSNITCIVFQSLQDMQNKWLLYWNNICFSSNRKPEDESTSFALYHVFVSSQTYRFDFKIVTIYIHYTFLCYFLSNMYYQTKYWHFVYLEMRDGARAALKCMYISDFLCLKIYKYCRFFVTLFFFTLFFFVYSYLRYIRNNITDMPFLTPIVAYSCLKTMFTVLSLKRRTDKKKSSYKQHIAIQWR